MSLITVEMILTASLALAVPLSSPPARPLSPQTLSERGLIKLAVRALQRTKDREQDDTRRPVELVALARVRPGQRVLDLIPGSGHCTRIFSRILGPKCHVYAVCLATDTRLATSDIALLQRESAADDNVTVAAQSGALPSRLPDDQRLWTRVSEAGTVDSLAPSRSHLLGRD